MPATTAGISVCITFIGSSAMLTQHQTNSSGSVSKPTLPQTFGLNGTNNRVEVEKYGFVLKQ